MPLAAAALVLPWLNPFTPGPSASVQPWLFSAVCAAVLGMLRGDTPIPWALAWPATALAGWAMLRSGPGLETLALCGALLVMALAAAFGRSLRQAGAAGLLASTWLAAAALSTLIALAQYFGFADAMGPLVSHSAMGEAYANLRQRNQFASLSTIGLAAAAWYAAREQRVPWWLWAAAAWLATGTAATTSRTGLVELAVLMLLVLMWSRRLDAPVRLMAGACVAYLAACFVLPVLGESVPSAAATSLWERTTAVAACSSRRVLWSNVMDLIALRPWAGWGWGELDYAHYATLYPGPRFCDILDNAHNLPLHLAVELGVPAAAAAVALFAGLALHARPWAEADRDRRLGWSVAAVLAVHSLVEYPLWYGPFELAAGLAIGLLARETAPAARARLRWALPALLAVAVAYAAWDYRRVSQIYLPPDERLPAYQEDTIAKVKHSWLFSEQAEFAELTLATLDRANAQWMWEKSERLLHYSPEPKIIEVAIESATLLGRNDEALWHLARFRAAFPEAHEQWAIATRAQATPPPRP